MASTGFTGINSRATIDRIVIRVISDFFIFFVICSEIDQGSIVTLVECSLTFSISDSGEGTLRKSATGFTRS